MGEEVNKKNFLKNNKKWIGLAILLVLIVCIIIVIVKYVQNDDIKKVNKVLKTKYYNIECIDSYCNGIVAEKGEKLKDTTVVLLNNEGKKVAQYKYTYDSKAQVEKKPYQISNNYFLMKKTNIKTKEVVGYSICDKNGKDLYSTENNLTILNDEFVLMTDDDRKTVLLSKKGKELYSNINDVDTYDNGNIVYLNIENEHLLLDNNGEKLLDNYKVSKEVTDEKGNTLYLIIKDVKDDIYRYYDVKKLSIKGDSFQNYTNSQNNDELIITKKENGKEVKYLLDKKGKQTKIEDNYTQVEMVNFIKEKISSSDYYLYTISVSNKDQNNVLVDNKKDKKFGVLDLKNNKFKEIYSYKSDVSNLYSSVTKLKSNDEKTYFQITCNSNNCDKANLLIYNLDDKKVLYSSENLDLVAQSYIQYEDDYKVIKYSSTSKNSEYKGKYVLYDKDNKELLKSSNKIVVIGKEILIGDISDDYLTLYSEKENKVLNSESKPANVITVSDEKLYKYTDSENKIVILNTKGKEVLKVDSSEYLNYSNDSIVYLNDKLVKIYNVKNGSTRKYKLKENEKLNDGLGDIIPPYRGALFVNNSSDMYVKVINSKGNNIKTIKKVELSRIYQNNKNNNVFMIVKKNSKTGNVYGLYLAK